MGLVVKLLLGVFVVSIFGLWLGFDATRVSYYSSELAAFDIKEIEKNGIGDKRYIKVDKAVWDGSMVYKAKLKKGESEIVPTSKIDEVIIPLMSTDELLSQLEDKNSKVKVLVKYDMPYNTKLSDLDTWMPEQTTEAGQELAVSGVTLVGLGSIDSETQRLITSLKHDVSPDVIFLKAGDKPAPLQFGLIILGLSLLGFFGSPFAAYKIYFWNRDGSSSEADPTPLNLKD